MTDAETEQTAELLGDHPRQASVVVVEHDMAFVRALGVKVTVLHEGSVLAEGTIDQVQQRRASSKSIWGDDDMLEVSEGIDLHYGAAHALRGISLTAEARRRDLRAWPQRRGQDQPAARDRRPASGEQRHASVSDGTDITALATGDRARAAASRFVPQGREIFPLLTVEENLETGFAPLAA